MSWEINPHTGDYVMTNGAPIDSASLRYPAYYRLKIPRTRWMYAPDDKYGSDLYTLQKRFSSNDVTPATAIAKRALQPIVDDGRAKSVTVEFLDPAGRNDIQMAATLVDKQGKPHTLNLPPVGGNV